MRFHYFFCWFSNVLSVFITFSPNKLCLRGSHGLLRLLKGHRRVSPPISCILHERGAYFQQKACILSRRNGGSRFRIGGPPKRFYHFVCWFSSVSSVFITFVVDFRVYQAFLSLVLLIFECIKRFYHFVCWFSSVSSVFITFFVDFRVYQAFL